VFAVLARTGRLLAAHGPALLAWMLGGTLAHFLLLKLAALVGARSAVGGILLVPLAALALLIAYVAMLLVLRDGMPSLRALAPLPGASEDDRRARRAAFLNGVLGGILPFFAFYAAWGFLRSDVAAYLNDAFEWQFAWGLSAAVEGTAFDRSRTIDDLGVNPLTVGILVIAFAGRWAFKRFGSRLPRILGVFAVYLEALWVYLAAYVLADLIGLFTSWVQTRQGLVWLADLRAGLTGWLEPVGIAWDAVGWALGEAGGIMLLPLAWLTIAGVIYGQAVKAEAPRIAVRRLDGIRTRYGAIPQRVRRRLSDLWGGATGRFRPIWAAIVLMWRAGPVLIGAYVLLFTIITLGEQWLMIALSRAVGPHNVLTLWAPITLAIVTGVGVIVEPVRIALIASTYDDTVARLRASVVRDDPADGKAEIEGGIAGLEGDGDDQIVEPAGVVGERRRKQNDGGEVVVGRDL